MLVNSRTSWPSVRWVALQLRRRVALEARVERIVRDDGPRRRADREDDAGRAERDRAPAEVLDQQAQRHLRDERAEVADHQPEARQHREALRAETSAWRASA